MSKITTLAAVGRFLKKERFVAPSSTLDRHFKAGKFGLDRDGAFKEKVLLEYAHVHLKKADTGKKQVVEDLSLARRKKVAEAKKTEEQAELVRYQRLKIEKKLVPRGLYEKDLAARMAFFSGQLDAWFPQLAGQCVETFLGEGNSRAEQLVDLVGGDEEKIVVLVGFVERLTPELTAVFAQMKQQWLQAFARGNVHVVELEEFLEDSDA